MAPQAAHGARHDSIRTVAVLVDEIAIPKPSRCRCTSRSPLARCGFATSGIRPVSSPSVSELAASRRDHPDQVWPFGQNSRLFRSGSIRVLSNRRRSHKYSVAGMLTERQLALLRASSRSNRVAAAHLPCVRHPSDGCGSDRCDAGLYVSDVARGRYSTITVASAYRCERPQVHPVLRLLERGSLPSWRSGRPQNTDQEHAVAGDRGAAERFMRQTTTIRKQTERKTGTQMS